MHIKPIYSTTNRNLQANVLCDEMDVQKSIYIKISKVQSSGIIMILIMTELYYDIELILNEMISFMILQKRNKK